MNAIRAYLIDGKKRSLENYKKGYKMRDEKAKQLKK